MRGHERAEADLQRGDARAARERLKGLIATYPFDVRARTLLARAYRDDGQPTEAGRWGYLVGPAATDAERRSFERHCAFGPSGRITEARLRHLLRCPDLDAIADADGRAALASLPARRPPGHRDGPRTAVLRALARLRALRRYR